MDHKIKKSKDIVIEVVRVFGDIRLSDILKNIILKEGSLDV